MGSRIAYHRPVWMDAVSRQYEDADSRKRDKAFYSSARWVRFRASYLRRHPLCVDCLKAGKTTAAQHVHHVEPRRKRPELAYLEGNLESLCVRCHNAKEIR